MTEAQQLAVDWINTHINESGESIYMYFESSDLQNEIYEACVANGILASFDDNELAINRATLVAAGGVSALKTALENSQTEQQFTPTKQRKSAVNLGQNINADEPRYNLAKQTEQAQEVAHAKSQKRGFRKSRQKSGK